MKFKVFISFKLPFQITYHIQFHDVRYLNVSSYFLVFLFYDRLNDVLALQWMAALQILTLDSIQNYEFVLHLQLQYQVHKLFQHLVHFVRLVCYFVMK